MNTEPPSPKVTASWLRFDDVWCVRCRLTAGDVYNACFMIAGEGVTCWSCTTDAEKARAVPQP